MAAEVSLAEKRADKHYVSCQPRHALVRGKGETEEGLSTWSEGTDGRGQM